MDMYKLVLAATRYMTVGERIKFSLFLIYRSFASLLDLLGVLAIGYLAASTAFYLSRGGDVSGQVSIGSLSLPSVGPSSLPAISVAILSLFVLKALISVLLTRQLALFLARIEARSARDIALVGYSNGLEESRDNSREEVVFAIQIGSPSAFNAILNSVGTLVSEGFLFLLLLVSFYLINPAVALLALLYFGIIGAVIQVFLGRVMHSAAKRMAEGTIRANLALADLGEVTREATVLSREHFFIERIYRARLEAAGSNASQFVLAGMPRYIVETALIIAIAVFVVVQALSGDLVASAATIGVFLSGGLRLTASLLPLQSALLTIKQSLPPATKALDILEKVSSIKGSASSPDPAPKSQTEGRPLDVTISNLSFSYVNSKEKALDSISLKIRGGSQAAIIGVSGSGKSTLADLILGLLNPSSGTVLVGAHDPREFMKMRPGEMSYVPQNPGMVSGSIASNIALGLRNDDIDEGRLKEAITKSFLSKFINSLPEGVNTDLGKRKDELSGGQIQRIGLARALYTRPTLLVMDEATSSLDGHSENEIKKALDAMRGTVTVILIAHRLNTIQEADVVFFVEAGKVVDAGTFPELVKRNAKVKQLTNLMSINP